jgi:RNA polymerase sigma-70 factor, ECF subfamily
LRVARQERFFEMTPRPEPETSPPAVASAAVSDDAIWLAAAAQGDAAAFRRLVTAHLSHAAAIARGMLRDPAEAEDVAQEAFLRLWRNAGQLELGPGGIKPWLRRVVSNLCIDRLRSGRNTTVTDEVPEQLDRPRQLDGLEERDLQARVQAALAELPERQRLALVLFHFEGLSQIEVGAAIGVSDEAVESLLARARRALKAALKDDWQSLLPDRSDGLAG